MVAFRRKKGESFKVGDDVTVFIDDISYNSVDVRVHAPQEIAVHRTEVYHKIRQEKEKAEREKYEKQTLRVLQQIQEDGFDVI